MRKISLISFIASTGLLIYLSVLNSQKEISYNVVQFKEETILNRSKSIKKEKEIIDVYSIDECNKKEHHGNCIKCGI